jgi:hypothetical protein
METFMQREMPPEMKAHLATLDTSGLEAFMVEALLRLEFPLFDAACAEIDRRRARLWAGEPASFSGVEVRL